MSVAIICEGINDINFLMDFIEYLGKEKNDTEKYKKNNVRKYIMGGKSFFFKGKEEKLETLKNEIKSSVVKKSLFIIDADKIDENNPNNNGFDNTKKDLEKLIAKLKIKSKSDAIDFYIMCDPNEKEGSLDSLILSTVDDENLRNCIKQFLKCSNLTSKEDHKTILNQVYKKLYPKEPYNFDHPNFAKLRTKLEALFK